MLNIAHTSLGLVLTVRHFAEGAARFWCSACFPFSNFVMANWLHCSLASLSKGKENDNVPCQPGTGPVVENHEIEFL